MLVPTAVSFDQGAALPQSSAAVTELSGGAQLLIHITRPEYMAVFKNTFQTNFSLEKKLNFQ